MTMLFNDIKLALRVSHNSLDSEITDLIDGARLDLIQSGISYTKANDDTDALIKRAITVYVKANFISDAVQAERFQNSYNLLKNHLSLAGDYQ